MTIDRTLQDNVGTLRDMLFAQLRELRDTGTEDRPRLDAVLRKAEGVAKLADAITGTAKVEVAYLHGQAKGVGEAAFLEHKPDVEQLPNGITAIVTHRLRG